MTVMHLICLLFVPVRQKGRKLKTRISEYRNHIWWNSSKSVITDHQLGHFNWNNIQILDEELIYNKFALSQRCLTLKNRITVLTYRQT